MKRGFANNAVEVFGEHYACPATKAVWQRFLKGFHDNGFPQKLSLNKLDKWGIRRRRYKGKPSKAHLVMEFLRDIGATDETGKLYKDCKFYNGNDYEVIQGGYEELCRLSKEAKGE